MNQGLLAHGTYTRGDFCAKASVQSPSPGKFQGVVIIGPTGSVHSSDECLRRTLPTVSESYRDAYQEASRYAQEVLVTMTVD